MIMTREEEIKIAAYQYGVLYAKYEIYQEDSSFIAGAEWADAHPTIFNQCVNEQSPDYLAGYEQGRKDANPEIAYLEYDIERLKSKLQAADDLNTLLTAELEKAKFPWISVEDRLPDEKLNEEGYGKGYSERVFVRFERVYDHGQKDIDYDTSNYMNVTKTWLNHNKHYTYYTDRITHWMPISQLTTTKKLQQ